MTTRNQNGNGNVEVNNKEVNNKEERSNNMNINEMTLEERLELLRQLQEKSEEDSNAEFCMIADKIKDIINNIAINKNISPVLISCLNIISDTYEEKDLLEIVQYTRYSDYRTVISEVLEKGINKIALDNFEAIKEACIKAGFEDQKAEYKLGEKTITLRIKEKTTRTKKKEENKKKNKEATE